MRLWLQRHAPVLCVPGLCYGATDLQADADATHAAAVALARELPAGVVLWTSPLARCVRLARALEALRPDLGPARADARLAEMHFGAWEGRPWDTIARAEMDAWMADFADHRAGGNGESTRIFMARVQAAWADWQGTSGHAAWITHAGVMRAIERIASGQGAPAQPGDWPSAPIALGAWRCVPGVPLAGRPSGAT